MHVPYFWSRKWFKYLVLVVILYALIRILHTEQKDNKFYHRLLSLNKLDLWSSSRNVPVKRDLRDSFDVVDVLPNCGITYTCPENTFPAHIDTQGPRICVMGKYLSNHAGNGGRGLNIAVIDGKRFELKSFITFDVYMESSVVMDLWINTSVKENDIIIVFTYDEASRMLKDSSRKLFHLYGSSKVQDLQFRSQWFMISQKGIQGFTPYEKVTMARNKGWGKPIDERLCVP